MLGRVLELQDRDQWTSPASFFFVAVSRARRYSQKQRRFDGRSPGSLAGSASASEFEKDKPHNIRINGRRICKSFKGNEADIAANPAKSDRNDVNPPTFPFF